MKKSNLFIPIIMSAMLITTPLSIYAQEVSYSSTNIATAVPRFSYTYEETITKSYSSPTDVPDTYYYEYYNNNWDCWFRGTLKLKSVTQKNGKYIATFTGTMYGSPT